MPALRKLSLLVTNPQNWIEAIFVLTVLGLGTGWFEHDDHPQDQGAVSQASPMQAETTVAEWAPRATRP